MANYTKSAIREPVFAPAQLTLRGLGITVTLLCVFLGIALYSGSALLGMLLLASPFFLCLWALWLLIARPGLLATSFFAAHSIAVGIIARWALNTSDSTERWVRVLPLIFIDMPVGGPGLLFALPTPIAAPLLFILGGAVWAFFGWHSARGRNTGQTATMRTTTESPTDPALPSPPD